MDWAASILLMQWAGGESAAGRLDALVNYFSELYESIAAKKDIVFIASGVGVVVGMIVKEMGAGIFGQKYKIVEERRKRRERLADIFVSVYFEIALELKTTCMSMTFDGFEQYLKKMHQNENYFPIWSVNNSRLFVFENEIKKETLALPPFIKTQVYDFYQNYLLCEKYIQDARNEDILKISQERRIAFVQNLYFSYFETAKSACEAVKAFELSLISNRRHYPDATTRDIVAKMLKSTHPESNFANLDWVKERFPLVLPVPPVRRITDWLDNWLVRLAETVGYSITNLEEKIVRSRAKFLDEIIGAIDKESEKRAAIAKMLADARTGMPNGRNFMRPIRLPDE